MKSWDELEDQVRQVHPNKARAKSLLKMAYVRLEEVQTKDREKFASLAVEAYYEIMKEVATALMSIEGRQTSSHEALVAYLKHTFPQFSRSEILLIDRLRKLRNAINYKGFFVTPDFLKRNEPRILNLISKMIDLLKNDLRQ
ncbi:MAG TPA: hypothetical protein ENN60_03370 [archaeon]|nr:hypothetical protein [archaeon]